MVENTCIREQCYWWELTGGKCPNYVESWWKPPETTPGQPILIMDCAPKRTMIMVQELSNRVIGVQKAQEEQRNEFTETRDLFNKLVLAVANRAIQKLGAEKPGVIVNMEGEDGQ